MCIRTKISLIVMIACCFIAGATYAGESLEADIMQLRNMGAVTGSAIGVGASPGSFYILLKVFIKKGAEEDFIKLTEHKNPVVRCMGLFCFAQHRKSINILKEHITDSDIITYCPGGCVFDRTTVGSFARELLNNTNSLNIGATEIPILSKDQLIGLDIYVLSRDSTSSFHNESVRALSKVYLDKGTTLTLPDFKPYQIIKAVGRLGITPQQREFLFACVRDENLDHVSRLTATSALTRDANETVLSYIESERAHLNNLTEGNLGDRFLETLQNRISHEKFMEVVRELSWRKKENLDSAVIKALSNSHLLAFPDLTNDRYLWKGPHHDHICNIVGASLVKISKNLEQINQPWNTYSDTAYALNFVIETRKGNLLFDHVFTPARRSEIEKNVKKAIENHFEEKSISSEKK